MKARRVALDGAQRRRVYLFRHGAVDYIDEHGNVVADPDDVALNERGRQQAGAMCELFASITIDRAVCSGMRRARETANRVLGNRDLVLEEHPQLREIRAARDEQSVGLDLIETVAFGHWAAAESGSRFLGGELYADFYARVSSAMESLMKNPDWHNLAIFAHGGTNAAILGWTSGLGLSAFGVVDQATCCLNVLDFDFDANDERPLRKVVRAMNVTVDDPAKSGRHSSGMESLARRLMKLRS
jgi:probable phosphoglycerate mutase